MKVQPFNGGLKEAADFTVQAQQLADEPAQDEGQNDGGQRLKIDDGCDADGDGRQTEDHIHGLLDGLGDPVFQQTAQIGAKQDTAAVDEYTFGDQHGYLPPDFDVCSSGWSALEQKTRHFNIPPQGCQSILRERMKTGHLPKQMSRFVHLSSRWPSSTN